MLGSKEWINFIEWLSWQVVVFGCSFNNNIIKSMCFIIFLQLCWAVHLALVIKLALKSD